MSPAAKPASAPAMLRAKQTFWWGQRPVMEGDMVPATDPVTKGPRAALFEQPGAVRKSLSPEQRIPQLPVEKATKAPGEKRGGIRIPGFHGGRVNDDPEPPEGRARAKARAAAAAKAAGQPAPAEDDGE